MEKRIQSIQRAINILNCFTESEPELSLSDISSRLGLHINTTRGIINTLAANGLISHNLSSNTYSLGVYFNSKYQLFQASNHINLYIECANPFVGDLAKKYSVFASLQRVFDNKIMMVSYMQPGNSKYQIMADMYAPLQYHCTSSGKIFLQYQSPQKIEQLLENYNFERFTQHTTSSKEELLFQLQRQNSTIYSFEHDEQATGISSLSAPVFNAFHILFGSISITAPTQVIQDHFTELTSDLIHTGNQITAVISRHPELF